MTWFSRFFRKPDSSDRRAALLNEGLGLAMAFGQDWLKPIHRGKYGTSFQPRDVLRVQGWSGPFVTWLLG
jgi:hypothetical protein